MAQLFRHYKGKFYLLHKKVLHSETLESLVYYESLYENEKGKHWVRPEAMFYEQVEVNGVKQLRFAPVEPEYKITEKLTEEEKNQVVQFFKTQEIFPEFEEKKFLYQLEIKSRLLFVIAYFEEQLIGIKIGYLLSPYKFYSWMGGVAPQFRRGGIAKKMMTLQHQWCRQQKVILIETRTKNSFLEMISLNLKSGFQIVGTKIDKKGETKILLEKKL
ncbi:MAG: GNAT family N-acetyltransferase [Bdellovibrionia bacterium]